MLDSVQCVDSYSCSFYPFRLPYAARWPGSLFLWRKRLLDLRGSLEWIPTRPLTTWSSSLKMRLTSPSTVQFWTSPMISPSTSQKTDFILLTSTGLVSVPAPPLSLQSLWPWSSSKVAVTSGVASSASPARDTLRSFAPSSLELPATSALSHALNPAQTSLRLPQHPTALLPTPSSGTQPLLLPLPAAFPAAKLPTRGPLLFPSSLLGTPPICPSRPTL